MGLQARSRSTGSACARRGVVSRDSLIATEGIQELEISDSRFRQLDDFLATTSWQAWGEEDYPFDRSEELLREFCEEDWGLLEAAWQARDDPWKYNLAWALGQADAERAVPLLVKIVELGDRDSDHRWQARETLDDFQGGPKHAVSLADAKVLMETTGRSIHACMFALAETGDVDAAFDLLAGEETR